VSRSPTKRPITLPDQQQFIDYYAGEGGHAPKITSSGYEKRDVPTDLHSWLTDRIDATWKAGREHFHPEAPSPADAVRAGLIDASWDPGNPPESGDVPAFINCTDTSYQRVLTELHALHEEWAGIELTPVQFWGPRVYLRNAVLARHIDIPTTHIISASITIDCRLDKPWPMVLEREDGEQVEVNLAPGEMLLYEGARLPHYRPKPLEGDYYINLYLHYVPRNAAWDAKVGTWVF
jgi:hypothetical protein